ncbi:hypothetical protein A2797_00840 [candidate division WWE3 bacterium RIFCSPHIGHO2_01_FULL_48_15]|uniref:AAA+ ATPase domain-containing protein n=1 Tax=candidate division WWE3 bacterium RIFCSPHIGHO2_01_FULL_48_15 TaxID=1802619 RepID=A0A1F4VG38_UNCKA|nr:MAG: hypothetical protein A2797_00840 [candidate division WWE3 bacterium RIFCSPHIGHO2_01_FULL_48_15]
MGPGKPPPRLAPLDKRQRDFVFKTPTKFAPVTRDQIHGANYILNQLDPHIALTSQFDPVSDDSSFCRGILLHGPAGSGKTYVARYFATVTGAHFIDAREFPREESDEQQWTRYDIKSLFALLKKYVAETKKPIILFWDQFDEFIEHAEDEPEILNQLYVELDGLEGSASGIVLIAATTKSPAEFDEQLMRPGRISIHVHFEVPTKKGRARILRFYLDQKPHEDFDAESLAELIDDDDVTPAAIKELIEFAYDKARLRSGRLAEIGKQDLVATIVEKIVGNPGAAEEEKTPQIRLRIAIHEIGHATVAYILGRTVILVGTISSNWRHGLTVYNDASDDPFSEYFISHQRIADNIAVAHGGLVANRLAGYPDETGSSSDCAKGSDTSHSLVKQLTAGQKMRENYGLLSFGAGEREKSQRLLLVMESDEAKFTKKAEALATEILEEVGKDRIVQLAEVLCREKVLLRDEIETLFQKHEIQKRLS